MKAPHGTRRGRFPVCNACVTQCESSHPLRGSLGRLVGPSARANYLFLGGEQVIEAAAGRPSGRRQGIAFFQVFKK